MVHRIRRIDPLSAAKVCAVLYFLGGLIAVPFLILASMMAPDGEGAIGLGLAIVIPVVYAVMGFIVTLIACAIYNLVAGWVGGIEMELE